VGGPEPPTPHARFEPEDLGTLCVVSRIPAPLAVLTFLSNLALVGSLCSGLALGAQDLTTHIDDPVDLTDEGVAFVEYVTERELVYIGERVPLRLRFGFEETVLREQLIQLFVRRLDIPVLVEAPWFEDPQRAEVPRPWLTDAEGSIAAPLDFALNGEQVATHRVTSELRDGKTYTVLEIERDILPTRAPDLLIERPKLRFARGTRFRESLLDGRVAEDRQDAIVYGSDLRFRVEHPPSAGQPSDFQGLIGTYEVAAEVTPNHIAMGESLEFVLHVTGTGELGAWVAPRLTFRDFRILGEREIKSATGRRIGYTLEPLDAAAREVPPIEITYFDPTTTGTYRTLRTAAWPIQVDPDPETIIETAADGTDETPADEPPILPLVLVIIVGTVSMVMVLRRRRAMLAKDSNAGASLQSVVEQARRAHPDDAAAAFQACLGALVNNAAGESAGTSIQSRLIAAGLGANFARRAGSLSERLDARKFGGASDDDLDERLNAWLTELASCSD
jgi:hypothetical protein